MGKCFLWLWGGFLFGLAFAVSELSSRQASLARCLSGAVEWMLMGGALTVIAVICSALYTLFERQKRCQ